MSITPLTLLKAHLAIEHDDDDELLAHKLDTAESWVAAYIGLSFRSGEPALTEAALQLAAYWYGQRESASVVSLRLVPFGVHELLASYREQVTGYDTYR